MQADLNPFVPGAGATPPELAGRDDILTDVAVSYKRAINGISPRSFMLIGLRGVGKTALLTKLAQQAEETDHCMVSMCESQEGESLAKQLFPLMKSTLLKLSTVELAKDIIGKGLQALRNFAKSFKLSFENVEISIEPTPAPGVADSGELEYDLTDLFELIGTAARKSGRAWLLLIDEVQYLSQKDLGALIVAMHRVSQRGFPIVLIGAGLPQVARLAGEAKSYAERLFDWRRISSLKSGAIETAIRVPLEQRGLTIEKAAVEKFAEITEGYPFFIQALAFYTWLQAQPPTVTVENVRAAYRPAIESMIDGIFNVRYDRLTATEIDYVNAMAKLDASPYRTSDVAKASGCTSKTASKIRDSLIRKGTIYSPKYGYVDFTIPLFAKFLTGALLRDDV